MQSPCLMNKCNFNLPRLVRSKAVVLGPTESGFPVKPYQQQTVSILRHVSGQVPLESNAHKCHGVGQHAHTTHSRPPGAHTNVCLVGVCGVVAALITKLTSSVCTAASTCLTPVPLLGAGKGMPVAAILQLALQLHSSDTSIQVIPSCMDHVATQTGRGVQARNKYGIAHICTHWSHASTERANAFDSLLSQECSCIGTVASIKKSCKPHTVMSGKRAKACNCGCNSAYNRAAVGTACNGNTSPAIGGHSTPKRGLEEVCCCMMVKLFLKQWHADAFRAYQATIRLDSTAQITSCLVITIQMHIAPPLPSSS